MRGHVDAESLALCAEGLLSRRRGERIRSHVAGCPDCAATQARLTEVPALLAQVPPPSVPPGIAVRLDAALSAEAARRSAPDPGMAPDPATAPDGAAPAQSPGTVPRPRAGHPRAARPRVPRLRLPVAARVLAAAGVLVVAGGVGYVVAQTSSPSSSSSAGSNAAAEPRAAAGPHRPTSPEAITPAAGQGGSAQFTVRRSGTRYRRDTFAAQAAALLNQPSAGLLRPGKVSGLSRQHQTSALVGCVSTVAGAGNVKLVDQARYQGRPATIIVVAQPSSATATVYVVGPQCSPGHPGILAQKPLPASG
jgi:hypothetical protein